MRPVREITSEEENFRLEQKGGFRVVRRDPVEPEPVGTIVLMAFRVSGYDQDCDGSLMARLENIGGDGEATGWCPKHLGLNPRSDLVVDPEEFKQLPWGGA